MVDTILSVALRSPLNWSDLSTMQYVPGRVRTQPPRWSNPAGIVSNFLNIVWIRFRWKLNSFVYVTIYVLEYIWLQCQIFWPVRMLKWRQAWVQILSLRNDHLREQAPLPVELVNPKARLQLVTKNAPQIGNFRFIDFHDLIHHCMLTGTLSLVCPTAMCSKRATSS